MQKQTFLILIVALVLCENSSIFTNEKCVADGDKDGMQAFAKQRYRKVRKSLNIVTFAATTLTLNNWASVSLNLGIVIVLCPVRMVQKMSSVPISLKFVVEMRVSH